MGKNLRKQILFLLISILAFIATFAAHTRVIAAAEPIELVIAGPGEIASSEMLFTWRSTTNTSKFCYFETDGGNTQKIDVSGELENTIFTTEKIGNYRYKLELENLEPGTEYTYYIESGGKKSSYKKFQTAHETGDFNFLWVSDNHAYPNINDRQEKFNDLYDQANEDLNNDISFVLSTGDDTAYGGNYNNWQTLVSKVNLFEEKVYASTPGNHTCYDYSSDSMPATGKNKYFNAIFNTPENGTDEESTSYWFLYNSILFICLDSIVANSNGSKYLPLQRQFFIDTVEKNEGKYQYIIVFQHYPFMNALTGSRVGPYGTNYGKWYELFDQYGVDLALSGDHHCYYRSNSLYDDKVVEEGGTTYIGAPQIGGRHREVTEENDKEYYASRITSSDLAGNSGATYFKVTSDGITGTLIDVDGKVQDTYTISAKRPVTWESKKEELSSSLSLTSVNNKNIICFDNNYAKYVKTMEVYNGTNKVLSVSPYDTKKSSFELSSLEKNNSYNLKVSITFADNTKQEFSFNTHTYVNIGEIYNLQAVVKNSKLNISWKANLENNVVANYKIYVDNNLISTLASSATSCDIDLSKITSSSQYRLEAITSDGDIVYNEEITYTLLGDASFDGTVDQNDVNAIIEAIKSNKQYSENELKYLDINKNNKVDLGDAFTINAYSKNKISSLSTETFTVTIIDINGNIIHQESVKAGQDANFVSNSYYLSTSIKCITKDTTAVAVSK